MNYTIQMMDNDFNTVEFKVEEETKEAAIQVAFEDIEPEDVCMVAVFEEGCNISLPIEPVDRIWLRRKNEYMVVLTDEHTGQWSECSMEEAERYYGSDQIKLMINGMSGSPIGIVTHFEQSRKTVEQLVHNHNYS